LAGLGVAGGIAAGVAFWRSKTTEAPRAASPAPAVAVPAPPAVAPPVPAAPATFKLDLDTEPAGAVLELDGVSLGPAPAHRELPRDGRPHRIVARAPGRDDAMVEFVDRPPPSPLVLPRTAAAVSASSPRGKPERPSRLPARAQRTPSTPGAATADKDALDLPAAPAPAPPPKPVPPPPATTGNRTPVLD
jgi:hypothetical protein